MEYKKNGIKFWAVEDRPREKMLTKGRAVLTNTELIAILIGSGTKKESAIAVAQKILDLADNNLQELAQFGISDFCKIPGIGQAKAISIVAALELGRRKQLSKALERNQIKSSMDGNSYFQPLIGDLPHEEFWVLMLNRNNRIIKGERISIGGVAGTVADVKIIFKKSLELLASSLILAHNHPSGNLQPSEADKQLTKKVKQAGSLLDIKVLDHLIITNSGYFSFADEGMMF